MSCEYTNFLQIRFYDYKIYANISEYTNVIKSFLTNHFVNSDSHISITGYTVVLLLHICTKSTVSCRHMSTVLHNFLRRQEWLTTLVNNRRQIFPIPSVQVVEA